MAKKTRPEEEHVDESELKADAAEVVAPAPKPKVEIEVDPIAVGDGSTLDVHTFDTVTIHHDADGKPKKLEIAFKSGATHLYFQEDPAIGAALDVILSVADVLEIGINRREMTAVPPLPQ